jgi:hypothetical protein
LFRTNYWNEGPNFALGLDVNYIFESDSELKYGLAASYLTYFGKTVEDFGFELDYDNASFLPIAAAGRYRISDKFTLGADIGYTIGLLSPSDNDGGFYYRPMVCHIL